MIQKKRSTITLLTAFSFVVVAVTGLLAFALPFSIRVIGLHALIGFVFIVLIGLHVWNNAPQLKRYLRSSQAFVTLATIIVLTLLSWWQPSPIKYVLGFSQNLGPALDRFKVTDKGLVYQYEPDPRYRLELNIRMGLGFDPAQPPDLAIWLENASEYHIKTLHEGESTASLPYWDFKRRGWQLAKEEAAGQGKTLEELNVDAMSAATQNSSFDPADYILPSDEKESLPYRILIEINQPGDGQASLVYAVDIDNSRPQVFQLLSIYGYPNKEETDSQVDKEEWLLNFVDSSFSTALDLIDSALLTIERDDISENPQQGAPLSVNSDQ